MAEYDPMGEALGQASEPPADTGGDKPEQTSASDGPQLVEMDKAPGAPEPATGQSDEAKDDEAKDASPDSVDSEAAPDKEEQERGYLRHEDYTRKRQQDAAEHTERMRQLEVREQQMAQERQQFLETMQQLQKPGVPEQQQSTVAQQARAVIAADPQMLPAERAGLEVLAQIAETNDQLQRELAQTKERLDQYEPQIRSASESLQQNKERDQKALFAEVQKQTEEAHKLFGVETTQLYGQSIYPLIRDGAVNPQTEKPWTVPELVAQFSGRSLEEVRAAQNGNRQAARQAKVSAASGAAPAGPTVPADTGPLSPEQAIAVIGSTMPG